MRTKKYFLLLLLIVLTVTGCNKTGASNIESIDDLSGKRIGVQIGTTGDIYASDYKKENAGTVIERYNKGSDAISSLKNGKIDCVLIDAEPAKAFVEKNSDLSILEEEFANEDYAICISKNNTQLKEDINSALASLKEEGVLKDISDYYINGGSIKYETPEGTKYPKGKLVMATNAEFQPYEYIEGGKITGIDADMARAICDRLGYELVIEDMAFDSIIVAVQGGKADIGVAGMTVNEERLKNIDFTDPYTTARQVIVIRNGEAASKQSFVDSFKQSFIDDNRYEYILKGLLNTIIIAILAVIMGVIIGFMIAYIRTTYDMTGKMKLANLLCRVYLTIIRGTPTMIQLLIIYFVIFSSVNVSKIFVAVLAFGINSGAYVAEIIRGGIQSLDKGQFEGARSLGLTHGQTMRYVILPQTFKNTLPSLANEFIVLVKETSISGYIGLMDLTKAGDIIRSNTYQAFFPLVGVAVIYLIIVMLLTAGTNKLERSLKKNER